MIILDSITQGSQEWFAEKLGKPSASNISKVLTNDGKPSKQRDGYLYELAAEIITGQRVESYQNENMIAGQDREQESRTLYELMNNVEVQQVGVIYKDKDKKFLCSPDGVVNMEYGLELKNVLPKTQIKYLLDGGLPAEYFGQVNFSLYVTGFKFWDFLSYAPGLKPLLIRVLPDDKFIKTLEIELNKFCEELETIVEKIK